MSQFSSRLIAVLVVVALGAGAYFWWQQRSLPELTVVRAPVPPGVAAVEPAPAASAAAEPAIQFPIGAAAPAPGAEPTALPVLADADTYVTEVLNALLGRKEVLTFVQLDGFVRRVVATVDNLARSHAPRALWPVNPTPGRFTTLFAGADGVAGTAISPDNSLRYSPLVLLIESVDTAQAVTLYKRLYPLFQQAYEELGYPGRYFNDRLVAVIDHLLATPVQTGPIGVKLVEVKGTVPSLQPWVRYEFVDPALESLSAGQKILLRTGSVNHRRLQAKLLAIRNHLVLVGRS